MFHFKRNRFLAIFALLKTLQIYLLTLSIPNTFLFSRWISLPSQTTNQKRTHM